MGSVTWLGTLFATAKTVYGPIKRFRCVPVACEVVRAPPHTLVGEFRLPWPPSYPRADPVKMCCPSCANTARLQVLPHPRRRVHSCRRTDPSALPFHSTRGCCCCWLACTSQVGAYTAPPCHPCYPYHTPLSLIPRVRHDDLRHTSASLSQADASLISSPPCPGSHRPLRVPAAVESQVRRGHEPISGVRRSVHAATVVDGDGQRNAIV